MVNNEKPIIFESILAILLLFLALVLYVMLTTSPAGQGSHDNLAYGGMGTHAGMADLWTVSGKGPVWGLHVCGDGTLYAFTGKTGNTIYAIGPDGSIQWKYDVPDEWRTVNVFTFTNIKAVYAVNNSTLYLYVRENRTTGWNHLTSEPHPAQSEPGDWALEGRIIAISPNGSQLWSVPISQAHHVFEDTAIAVKNDRVYVFEDYNVTVLNDQGSILYKISNVSSSPAIDENGYVYVIPAVLMDPQPAWLMDNYSEWGYKVPSNVVEAYGPEGRLYWHTGLGTSASASPLYQNGTIWVAVQNGLWAFDTNGSVKWNKYYDTAPRPYWGGSIGLYTSLPLDSLDNVYLYEEGPGDPLRSTKSIHVISSNGSEVVRDANSYTPHEPGNSIIFKTKLYGYTKLIQNGTTLQSTITVEDMMYCDLVAYDAARDVALWNYTIVPNITVTVLTGENQGRLLVPMYAYPDATKGIFIGWNPINILSGKDVVYVTYSGFNVESPVILGQSKCGYASQAYAFDKKKGTLLWRKDLDALIMSSAVKGNTLYYGTPDGKIAARQAGRE